LFFIKSQIFQSQISKHFNDNVTQHTNFADNRNPNDTVYHWKEPLRAVQRLGTIHALVHTVNVVIAMSSITMDVETNIHIVCVNGHLSTNDCDEHEAVMLPIQMIQSVVISRLMMTTMTPSTDCAAKRQFTAIDCVLDLCENRRFPLCHLVFKNKSSQSYWEECVATAHGREYSPLLRVLLVHCRQSFLQAGCSSCRPTNSIKALKAYLEHLM